MRVEKAEPLHTSCSPDTSESSCRFSSSISPNANGNLSKTTQASQGESCADGGKESRMSGFHLSARNCQELTKHNLAATLETPRYYSRQKKFERFRGFLELISRFEFEFRRCELFFERFEFLVRSGFNHTMWLCICLCCGLFAPTQFQFECCRVLDDS